MSTAQIIFSIALGVVVVLVTAFSLYVASTTMWSNRWFRRR